MKRFVPLGIALLLACAPLTGCSFLRRQAFAPPVVTVTDVRVAGIGLQGGKVDVVLSMYNPNNFRLDATNVRYNLRIDTLLLANGTIDERLTMLQHDSATLHVPVNFGFKEISAAFAQLKERGTVPFTLDGDVTVLTAVGSVKRTFVQHGSYDGVNFSLLPPRKK